MLCEIIPHGHLLADRAVTAAHRAGTRAGVALLVDLVGARKGDAALPAVCTRGVVSECYGVSEAAKPVAILSATVFIKILPVVASQTMLAVLAGTVLAQLTMRDGQVVLGGALASVADVKADEPTSLADERGSTPALEKTDPGRSQANRAHGDAFCVQQIRPVSANATGVARHGALAGMAAVVKTATTLAGHHATLHPAAPARQAQSAPPIDAQPIGVATEALASCPAGSATACRLTAVYRTAPTWRWCRRS